MLAIRFSRVGRKNKPQFRLVVQEHTATPTGKNVEIVGSWDPSQKKGDFKNERIEYWLSQGAKASDSVHNLLISQKVIKGEKIKIKMSEKKVDSDEDEKKSQPATDDGVKEEVKKEEIKKEETPKKEDVKKEKTKEEEKK